jgi:hypothetical protein
MEKLHRVTISAAAFVLFCFFLPWVQVSCAGLKDSASGLDLARDGDTGLWLVPLLMCLVAVLGLLQVWKRNPSAFALIGVVSGLLSLYLMNHERINEERRLGLIGARLTGWFWLGFFASLAVALSALIAYLKRPRSP